MRPREKKSNNFIHSEWEKLEAVCSTDPGLGILQALYRPLGPPRSPVHPV